METCCIAMHPPFYAEDHDDESSLCSSSFNSSNSSSSDNDCSTITLPFFHDHPSERQWLRFIDDGVQWKHVEERFHQIASSGGSAPPAIDPSLFAFSIGMERAPDFAKELLLALRRRKDTAAEITKSELRDHWLRITHPHYDSRLQLFFDMCDKGMQGRITKTDLKQMIILSALTNSLALSKDEAECYASLIIQEASTNRGKRDIEFFQLKSLLSVVASRSANARSLNSRGFGSSDEHEPKPKSVAEILFRTYWRRAWIVAVWLVLCVVLFTWKFIEYNHRAGFQVMGYCLSAAKGSAETLKLNMALILLPVCRNTITWMRRNRRISSLVPFNDNINFHKGLRRVIWRQIMPLFQKTRKLWPTRTPSQEMLARDLAISQLSVIAGGIVVGVILHGGTHLACDLPRISQSDPLIFQATIGSQFGSIQPSYLQVLCTTEVATGITMVLLMAIAFSLATKAPRRGSPSLPRSIRQVTGYNAFWYSHHLFILVYALLIVHSIFLFLTTNVTEKTTWMYVAVPVFLYIGERVYRSVRSEIYEVKIIKAGLFTEVLSLKMSKPQGFTYRSGMYIYIKCPEISLMEWHPFSLTSGPDEDHLSVHIRSLGDWSHHLYSLIRKGEGSEPHCYPRVYIDGPYGAASQDHVKYDVVVLIGLGIGATPFISVLKDIASTHKRPSFDNEKQSNDVESGGVKGPLKAYLYWITREQGSLGWFRDAMNEISEEANAKQKVIEMSTYLSSVHQSGDARSVMLSVIQELQFSKSGTDAFSQTQVHTHFARPDWFRIFSNLAQRHAGLQIGVFYCGSAKLARELEKLCTQFSTKTTTRFVFHKENY